MDQGFENFLKWCIDKVRAKQDSAHGHFRHAGLNIEVFHTKCVILYAFFRRRHLLMLIPDLRCDPMLNSRVANPHFI